MNKPIRCGCGGEVEVDTKLVSCAPIERKRVYCSKCYISTEWMESEAEAIETWNKAMGADVNSVVSVFSSEVKDDFHPVYDCMVGKERIAKVERYSFGETLTYDFDGQCECGKWVDSLWDYCPSCGARLEWK